MFVLFRPVIIEVPHFAALRGKEREIVILRSDNGESWKEHTIDASEEILNDVLHDSFEAEGIQNCPSANHLLTTIFRRFKPTGRHLFRADNPHCHAGLPAVLRRGVACPAGGACHRTGGWNGVQYGGASSASGVPARRPHQED